VDRHKALQQHIFPLISQLPWGSLICQRNSFSSNNKIGVKKFLARKLGTKTKLMFRDFLQRNWAPKPNWGSEISGEEFWHQNQIGVQKFLAKKWVSWKRVKVALAH